MPPTASAALGFGVARTCLQACGPACSRLVAAELPVVSSSLRGCSCRLAQETRHNRFCLGWSMWPDGESLGGVWTSSRVVMTVESLTYW